jgi:hypothetical protein
MQSGKTIFFFLIILLLASCREVTIKVSDIPPNTPEGARLYVTGNFNYWDPGDPSYAMRLGEDSMYYIRIPRGFGKLEFKVTRGELASVETDLCGYHMDNRVLPDESNEMVVSVQSWKDLEPINCGHVTFKLKVPENTPEDEPISLAGNYNLWNPDDSASVFQKDTGSGEYLLTIPKPRNTELLSVKVTRGDLAKAEADPYGNEAPVRNIAYTPGDTIELKVDNWEDMVKPQKNNVTIVLTDIPENTPPYSDIYLAGSFNGWYPRDKNYLMKYYDGNYYYSLPRKGAKVEFKFTRGSWRTEEVDSKGNVVSNHEYFFGEEDTVRYRIQSWKDTYNKKQPKYIRFEIVKLPGNTPPGENIYITGSFNDWDPADYRYRLRPMSNGNLEVVVPRSRSMEFKFTRGNWDTQEVDQYGRKIKNRYLRYEGEDRIEIRIENWMDLYQKNYKPIKVILSQIPKNTPPDADIYFASDINDWDPRAKRFRLKRDPNGKYYIDLPVYRGVAYFKFTRGGWETVETDGRGYDINNRMLDFSGEPVQYFWIESWHDLPVK